MAVALEVRFIGEQHKFEENLHLAPRPSDRDSIGVGSRLLAKLGVGAA